MATYSPKRLGIAVATTSPLALYTTPSLTTTIISEIVLSNTSAVSVQAWVYLVPGGPASAGSDSNTLVAGVSIPANTTKPIQFRQVMNAGDVLAIKASANTSITAIASGVEIA